jgi:hypothetical protein
MHPRDAAVILGAVPEWKQGIIFITFIFVNGESKAYDFSHNDWIPLWLFALHRSLDRARW